MGKTGPRLARLSLQWALAVQSFKSAALKRFAEKQDARKLPAQHVRRIAEILQTLDAPDALRALQAIVKASGASAFPPAGA